MANNVAATPGTGVTFKTTDNAGVHTGHVNVDSIAAGTNAIGKLAANSGVDIGDVDVTTVITGTGATNLGKAEDGAHTSGDTGVAALAVRRDTAAVGSGTDGDYSTLNVNATGHLYTTIDTTQLAAARTTAGAMSDGYQLVAFPTDGPGMKAEDAASASGDVGMVIHAKRLDTPANSSGTDGDYEPLQVSAGRLWTSSTVTAITAGETHIGEVGGKTVVKTITMSADTGAMGANQVIATTQQLDAAFRKTDGTGVLQSLTVFDPDDNTAFAFDVYVHDTSTSIGTENEDISITDANAAAGIIGVVSFAATDVKDLINGKMYHKSNIGLPVSAVSGTDDLYFSIVNGSGTPTFTGGSIPMRVGILQD